MQIITSSLNLSVRAAVLAAVLAPGLAARAGTPIVPGQAAKPVPEMQDTQDVTDHADYSEGKL